MALAFSARFPPRPVWGAAVIGVRLQMLVLLFVFESGDIFL